MKRQEKLDASHSKGGGGGVRGGGGRGERFHENAIAR